MVSFLHNHGGAVAVAAHMTTHLLRLQGRRLRPAAAILLLRTAAILLLRNVGDSCCGMPVVAAAVVWAGIREYGALKVVQCGLVGRDTARHRISMQ